MKHIVIAVAVLIAIVSPHEVLCVTTTDNTLSTYNWEPKPVRTIMGKVLTPDGKPAKGITISQQVYWSDPHETITDDQGAFSLAQTYRRSVQLTVHGGRFAPETIIVGKDDDSPIEVGLKPGHWIKGRVIDHHGNPVEGAKITTGVFAESVTDKNGYFNIEGLAAGETAVTVTDAKGYGAVQGLPLKADTEDNLVELDTIGQICGTIMDAAIGNSVHKFRIRLESPRTRLPSDKSGVWPEGMYAGKDFDSPDGRFTIDGLTAGSAFRLIAEAPGYRRAIIRRVVAMERNSTQFRDYVLKLQPAYVLQGVITDAANDQPLAGVDITIVDATNASTTWMQYEKVSDYILLTKTKTDADGKFRLENVVIPVVSIVLEKPGYGRTILNGVKVEKPFSLAMPRAVRLHGVLPEWEKETVRPEYVSIATPDRSFRREVAALTGKFELNDLPAGTYNIRASRSKTSLASRVEAQAGREYEVNWNAPAPAELAGMVTFRGAPAVGASVSVSDDSGSVGFGKSDMDGHYRIKVLATGDCRLHAYMNLEASDTASSLWTRTSAKPTLKAGLNHLDIILPGGSVSGVVIDQKTKQAVANSTVHIYRKETTDPTTIESSWSLYAQRNGPYWHDVQTMVTERDGKFRFEGLPPGEYRLGCTPGRKTRYSHMDFAYLNPELAKLHGTAFLLAENEIMQDMRLEIPDLTSLEVRVKDAKTGQTIPNPHTSLVDEEGFFIWGGSRTVALAAPTSTGKGARLVPERVERFDELVPGRYKLNVYDGTHLPYQTTIIVRQGQAAKLAVQLKRAQQVVFRLNEPAGDDLAPLARWQVGYRIVRSRDAKPFLEDGLGSYSGAVSSLWGGDPPRQLAIPVPPGEYDVEMMLAKHEDRSPQDKDIVWTGKAKVKVTKDKDGMIDIPLPKTSP